MIDSPLPDAILPPCPMCGTPLPFGDKRCANCGEVQGHLVMPRLPRPRSSPAELFFAGCLGLLTLIPIAASYLLLNNFPGLISLVMFVALNGSLLGPTVYVFFRPIEQPPRRSAAMLLIRSLAIGWALMIPVALSVYIYFYLLCLNIIGSGR